MTNLKKTLCMSLRLLEILRNHAQREYPLEACGFLIGESARGSTHVTYTMPVANNAVPETRRRAYAIAPHAWMSVEKQMDLRHHVMSRAISSMRKR